MRSMNSQFFSMRVLSLPALALSLFAATSSSLATTLQVVAVNGKSSAQFMIDGSRRDARVGYFTDEGLLLEKIADDTAIFRFNGLPQRLRVNEVAILDSQTQGYVSHQIRADQKNRYLTPALVNGGSLQAEIDRNADIIVIPVADADRLGLPYKDKPSRNFTIPKESAEPKATKSGKAGKDSKDAAAKAATEEASAKPATDSKDSKPGTYKTYSIELNSVRVGNVDVYGLRAVVTEKPGVTTTTIGRDFLRRLAPSWSDRTLTLVRR
jgi:predicted aspartyl protease